MASPALVDLLTPYVLDGAAMSGLVHELLSVLWVQRVDTAFDDDGVVVSGVARFTPEAQVNPPIFTPPASISMSGSASVAHREDRAPGAYWDFPDIDIRFRLTVPRTSSPVVDAALAAVPAPVGPLLAGWGTGTAARGDAPGTAFTFDLLFDVATLHLPFLRAARLRPDGMLEADPASPPVKLRLPKIKLTVTQTAGEVGATPADPEVQVRLDSWAASDIDDPAGTAFAELLRMEPPYALIGPGQALGFGFESVILDLSGDTTPPELLEKFGVGEDFRGLYLPDVRVFFVLGTQSQFGFDISARELLIGIGPEGGVSGVFGLDIVHPASPQEATVSIYDTRGALVHQTRINQTTGNAPIEVVVPHETKWVVDATGGNPPYNITVDGQVQTTSPVGVTVPAGTTEKTVVVTITDVHTGGQSRSATFELTVTAPSASAGVPAPVDQGASLTVVAPGAPGFLVTMEDLPRAEQVRLRFTPPNPVTVTITPQGRPAQAVTPSGGVVTHALAHGASIEVTATWQSAAAAAGETVRTVAYFRYAEPAPGSIDGADDPRAGEFGAVRDNIHRSPSRDEPRPADDWTVPGDVFEAAPGAPFVHPPEDGLELHAWLERVRAHPAKHVRLEGTASRERQPNVAYNLALSQRRIWAIRALLERNGVTNPVTEVPNGEVGNDGAGRAANRRVTVSFDADPTSATTTTSTVRLVRPARPPLPPPVTPTVAVRQPVGPPDVQFREVHVRVQMDHNRVIAVEAKLKIDVKTVLENKLATTRANHPGSATGAGAGGSTALPVGTRGGNPADPNDGVVDVRVLLTLDDTIGRWTAIASLFENDRDGFLQTPHPAATTPPTANEEYWRTYFGVLVALAPLLDATATSNTDAGAITALSVGVTVPFLAAATDVVRVPRITMYGGELTISHDADGTVMALLLDVEVALIVSLVIGGATLIDTEPDNPITVRYRAVGIKTSDHPQLRDLLPVFDSSKGYEISVPSTGGIRVPAPLGDILQVAGTRVVRSNPVNLELDLTLKADLGVVSVDKTTVRIPLDGSGGPTITALGVHLDVPGGIEGHGYLAIYPDGFAGQIDASLPGLGVRVAAGLSVRNVQDPAVPGRSATAVLVTLEVDFPVPIALGNSGLGLYGFGGLFALHFRRDERPNDPVPALDWLQRVNGNPMDIAGWKPEIDRWAIGLGAVLGTIDAGFTLNVKGALVLELPGPRILLVMKANILWPRPPRQGSPEATILAVIDIDLGRERITIGLTFEWGVRPLIHLHVPVRAIFPFNDLSNFALDVGTWYTPATITFFEQFRAHGYFMLRGKGIPNASYDGGRSDFPLGQLSGFSVALGVSASFTWGSTSIGLYLRMSTAFHVGIGFSPVMFVGTMGISGELHLFIVGIEASAQLTVKASETKTLIDGEARGEIDLFFFTISGSVHVTLGEDPGAGTSAAPPLVQRVTVHSRSAALLAGSGIDRPIDGRLADAITNTSAPIPADEHVPIDSIVVVHFDCIPRMAGDVEFHASQNGGVQKVGIGAPPGSVSPAVRRGEPYYTYRLTKVTLSPDLTGGEIPLVWWTPKSASDPLDPETKIQLALLTRVPSAHPSAIERSRHLTESIIDRWSTVCAEVAPPARVLWTFEDQPLGPSESGWTLVGTAWPDPPATSRSVAPHLRLDVAETWRTGRPEQDLRKPVVPARVVGATVPCSTHCGDEREGGRDREALPNDVDADERDHRGVVRLDDPAGLLDLTRRGAEVAELIAASRARAARAPVGASQASRMPVVEPDDEVAQPFRLRASRHRCPARVLEAPFRFPFDDFNPDHPLAGAMQALAADLVAAEAATGDRLDDVVAFSPGATAAVRLLLLVPAQLLRSGQLHLRALDVDGAVLVEHRIDGDGASRVVTQRDDLPPEWLDPNGPWYCDVERVVHLLLTYMQRREGREALMVLVDTDVPEETRYLQLGIIDLPALLKERFSRPSYLVGVVDTLSVAEMARADTEERIRDAEIKTVNGALAPLASPPALLKPNTRYTVSVEWEWATCDANGDGLGAWTAGTPQQFAFHTDDRPLKPRQVTSSSGDGQAPSAKTMPVRLDGWILVTDPDDETRFFFHGEPLCVVFAVDYLLDMYAAYGVPLEARVRAASYKNASPSSPMFALTGVALSSALLTPLVGAAVFTPWEDTMRSVLSPDSQPCLASHGETIRHKQLHLNLLLEPMTDYVFDIEPAGTTAPAAGTSATPLFRRRFTTSRYANVAEMCAAVQAAEVRQSPADPAAVAALVSLATATTPIPARALDDALRAAGLDPVTPVDLPLVEVLWVPDAAAVQPRILVIRTPEPLVRTRRTPVDVEPSGQPRLGRKVARLETRPFLDVIPTVSPAAGPNPAMHMNHAEGGAVLVVGLDQGRGKTADLTVRRFNDPFLDEGAAQVDTQLISLSLASAPWEPLP